ncbi:iron-binding zinc finger CDGSH type domain-containing protein [Ditylenchus destructor]|uniref:Iron-binding zinc finger CDGSH type domain-containing protein n=1 Tax=Ditylenchus destructor TaxID=166010 RepID=A0AAD4NCU3_9BILA|nr:iron-binding zinc finger CDGSH type domain-containing protein [Ditylenchus destructor]
MTDLDVPDQTPAIEAIVQEMVSSQVNEECNKVREECIASLSEKIKQEMERLEAEKVPAVTRRNNLLNQYEASQKKYQDMENNFNEALNTFDPLTDQLVVAQNQLETLTKRINASTTLCEQMLNEEDGFKTDDISRKIKEANIVWSRAIEEATDYVEKIQVVISKRDALRAELDALNSDKDTLAKQLEEKNDEHLKKLAELGNKKDRHEKLNEKHRDSTAKVNEIQEKLAAIKFRNISLKASVVEMSVKVGHLQNENPELDSSQEEVESPEVTDLSHSTENELNETEDGGRRRVVKQEDIIIIEDLGEHVVGTEPSIVEFHVVPHKKPEQPYGIQGTDHLIKDLGKVAATLPTKVSLQKDKVYRWCMCGYSAAQPFCDGSHLSVRTPAKFRNCRPVKFIPERDMNVWWCNCKKTKNRPFCDGSHKSIKTGDEIAQLLSED